MHVDAVRPSEYILWWCQ